MTMLNRRVICAVTGAACGLFAIACRDAEDTAAATQRRLARIEAELAPGNAPAPREGLAAAILIDVSGSMDDKVEGPDGRQQRKIDIARRAANDLVAQFSRYAQDHPQEPVLLGIYEFSERGGKPDCRPIVPMAAPDPARASAAIEAMDAQGGTPIGNAMIAGKLALDATGVTRRHLLVVTDGANTDGFEPEDVAVAIGRRPEVERPSLYFVAFDIDEARFQAVREAGGLLLPAANARDLNVTLDSLLRGKILVER